ncbi:MAG TPA: ROK family protein [Acidimicrobiales bacterium]
MAPPEAATTDQVLAVDVGGTKFAAGLVDRSGRVLRERRVPTPAGGSARELWDALEPLVLEMLAPDSSSGSIMPAACGVGCGGPMSPGGGFVSPLNIPGWRDFPLKSRLAELTALPTWVDNDAKALALAEGWLGSAVGCSNYISMVVSTGIGGGIVLDGRLLEGEGGNAGHIGHVIVEPDGHRCGCGGYGCLEGEASGIAIAAITGRPPAEAAPEIIERTGRLVGRAVASVANLLDLKLATVAGSVALGFGEPFFAAAQREVDQRCKLSFSRGCRVVRSKLGSSGPLLGAAAVGWRGLESA